MHKRVDFALRSFKKNLGIVEEDLREIRKYIRDMQDNMKHGEPVFWARLIPGLLSWAWHHDAKICIGDSKKLRQKIRFYKRIISGLESGDLSVAIQALTELCPEPESMNDTIRRIRRDKYLSPFQAASRSPDVLRENTLSLRADLIKIQSGIPT